MKKMLIVSVMLLFMTSAGAQSFMFYRGDQPLEDNAEFTVTNYQVFFAMDDYTLLSLESDLRLKNITDSNIQATVTQTILEAPFDNENGYLNFCLYNCYAGNTNRAMSGELRANSFNAGYHANFYVYGGKYNRIKVRYEVFPAYDFSRTDKKTVTITYVYDENSRAQLSVTDVSLDQTTAMLIVGNDLQLTATVVPADATNKNLSWSSSAPDIAEVDDTGKVTALAAGIAAITVTTEDGGKTAICDVTVNPATIPVIDVSLDQTTAMLIVGNDLQLTATVVPADATNKNLNWNSSAPDIAEVDDTGKVTALAAGIAAITVVTEDGEKKATCDVTVQTEMNGIDNPETFTTHVFVSNQNLCIVSGITEIIDIYTVTGVKVYYTTKTPGVTSVCCSRLPEGLLIVKGSSGWVKKVVLQGK